MSGRPVLLMLLSRHPYKQQSGRGFMLRQRIAQARSRFETHIVVLGAPAGDESDDGLDFLPMASPGSAALNTLRLWNLPLQTWLYYSGRARREIAALAGKYRADAIYIDMLRLAPLARGLPARIARVIDYDDLLSERYRSAPARGYDVLGFLSQRFGPFAGVARLFAAPLLALEGARCAAYERAMLEEADLALFTSPREAKQMIGKGAPVLAAAPTMAPHAPLAAAPGRRLIFLGNMRYAENVAMLRALHQGVEALTDEGLWPTDAIIEAVGDHAEDLPRRFLAAPFRFLGRVDDLSQLAGAGIFLAPVVSGTGVKLKVLDGMALSCPVVATPKALEGLGARANRDLIVGADPKAVLSIALRLRDRPQLKAMLARRARAYLERAHAPTLGVAVCDAIEAAITRAKAR